MIWNVSQRARTPFIATTTLLLAASLTPSAFASQKHTLKPGETVFAIARHYHVSVQAIADANGLKNVDSVPDFTHLTIPDAPKKLVLRERMHRRGLLAADGVNVRRGPDTSFGTLATCDAGTPVVVTAEHDGWMQIALSGDRVGWVRADFVHVGGSRSIQVADNRPHRKSAPHARHNAPVLLAEDENKKARRRLAHHTASAIRMARKHRQHQEPVQVARHHKHHNVEVAVSHHHKHHALEVAHVSHRRHHEVKVARHERHPHHAIQVASHSHSHYGHHYVPEADAPAPTTDIVRTAYAYRGTPYRWGGAARGGFDCSGFTSYLYRQRGVSLPHSARAQFHMGSQVGKGGMKPGDLVFFHTVTPGISHVGMYVGEGRFVHASSRRSGGVRVDNIGSGYYSKAFRGARRFQK